MIIHYAGTSVQGSKHAINTDQFVLCLGSTPVLKSGSAIQIGELKQSGLLLSVCNGIYEGKDGLKCAESSMNEILSLLEGVEDYHMYRSADGTSRLGEGMKRIHELLLQLTETREDHLQMMACASALWFCQDCAVYSQVGNTRIYRFKDSVLELLTEDHTEAWELVKQGKVTLDKIHTFPGHRVLTQVLGGKGKQKPLVEIKTTKIEDNDVFLLCTRGLVDGISDKKMEELLIRASDGNGVVDMNVLNQIMDHNRNEDNATAVLCQVFPDQSVWTNIIRSLDHS
jgi:PPM family protein phosphatase